MLKMEVLRGRDFVVLPGFFIESYETGTNEASRSKTLQTESQCQKPMKLVAKKWPLIMIGPVLCSKIVNMGFICRFGGHTIISKVDTILSFTTGSTECLSYLGFWEWELIFGRAVVQTTNRQ